MSGFQYMVLAEQDQLSRIPEEVAQDLHLYMICRRPRIAVVPAEFRLTADLCTAVFTAQYGDERRRIEVETPNLLGTANAEMQSEWPYGDFRLVTHDGEVLSWGRSSLLLTMLGHHDDNLDLDVLYVGQAFGSSGERSATKRLAAHETLQAIYGEAVRRSPDKDIFVLLLGLADSYGMIALFPVPGIRDDLVGTSSA